MSPWLVIFVGAFTFLPVLLQTLPDAGTYYATVVAYFCLSTGAVAHTEVPRHVRRNTPDPIPVMMIGGLAVDQDFQCRGIGWGLVRDAVLRTIHAASIAGIRAVLVQAISEQARQFYVRCGFHSSPVDPMTHMITIAEAVKAFPGPD